MDVLSTSFKLELRLVNMLKHASSNTIRGHPRHYEIFCLIENSKSK